jgi:hypothetical protein
VEFSRADAGSVNTDCHLANPLECSENIPLEKILSSKLWARKFGVVFCCSSQGRKSRSRCHIIFCAHLLCGGKGSGAEAARGRITTAHQISVRVSLAQCVARITLGALRHIAALPGHYSKILCRFCNQAIFYGTERLGKIHHHLKRSRIKACSACVTTFFSSFLPSATTVSFVT